MALVLADRVKETTTTAGTGTVTLLGAATGFQSFAVIGNGNTTFYCIAGQTTSEWEVGIGTYTSSGTTLARTTVLSNSAGTQPTALTFSAGTKDVFVTYPSSKSVNLDASGNMVFSGITAQRFQADFSNATFNSRYAFQTSTANSTTGIYALPNGTSTAASWQATNAADPTNASKILIATNGSTDVQLVSGINGTGTYLPLTFYTSGAEKMRLDTSGNLGLGVTPSNLYTAGKVIQVGVAGGSTLYGSSSTSILGLNTNLDATGTLTYATTSTASYYRQSSGLHYWYNAPSGTAGTTITFTQAMTLDTSGNLGLGVSPSAWGSAYKAIQGYIGAFALSADGSSNNQMRLSSNAYNNGTNWLYYASSSATSYEQRVGEHRWYNAPSGTAGTAITFTQAMTLNASGALGFNSGGSPAYGTSGQVLTSNGSAAAPSWQTSTAASKSYAQAMRILAI